MHDANPDAMRTKRWVARQKLIGGCQRCTKPAKRRPDGRPMSMCAEHLAIIAQYWRDRRDGRAPISTRSVITKEMLVHDLQCVATRLGARRVSMPLYELEGSFSPKVLLDRRIQQRWSEVCVEAGLLPTYRGCRGIDERICRCGRTFPVYVGREHQTCAECRRVVRKRKTGWPVDGVHAVSVQVGAS